jgi:hypothetical protein
VQACDSSGAQPSVANTALSCEAPIDNARDCLEDLPSTRFVCSNALFYDTFINAKQFGATAPTW